MLLKIPHGVYLEEILKFVCRPNVAQIEFQDGTVYHPWYIAKKKSRLLCFDNLSHPGDFTLTEILFAVFFAKIHSWVLSVKILFWGLYWHELVC